ncbi:hypothetical protein [Aquimarina megaterium]|uniref:hypothetical protein n=1 Tax=Aquimarina megaterium TaxID=1443666 RepID=UPI001112ADD9|nr:hypothetical protein [Aquimarina megaterium]
MKNLFLIFCLVTFSCKAQDKNQNGLLEQCLILEESFDNNSMKKFLNSTSFKRDVIDKFIENKSEYSYLSITDDDIVFASLENKNWSVIQNERKYVLNKTDFSFDLESFTNLDKVYKLDCPENFIVFDSNVDFQAIWIKKAGELRFLYYSTKCDQFCLPEKERKKVSLLMKINDFFVSNTSSE